MWQTSHPLVLKGKNRNFVNSNSKIGLHSDIYRPIYIKLGVIIKTTKFNILIPVWMTLTVIQDHSCTSSQKLLPHSLPNLSISLDEIQYIVTVCWFVDAPATFYWLCSRKRTLFAWFSHLYTVNVGQRRGSCERICFKVGVTLDTSKLYGVILVWKTLTISQGHRITRMLLSMESFCCNYA